MNSLYNKDCRDALMDRISRLQADMKPSFGKLSAPKMVTHLADQLRVARGEKEVKELPTGWFMRTIMKPLIIHFLSWPKGRVETTPEMLETQPTDFNEDKAALMDLIRTFPQAVVAGSRNVHPAFGELCGREWAILSYRHLDFHLDQFGV